MPAVITEDDRSVISYPPQNYLSWSKVGEIPWLINYTNGYNDSRSYNDRICLRSGPIKCAGESKLRMENISGPAIIQFKWKIDAWQKIGQLIFSVDGNLAFECFDRDWIEFSYPLGPGNSHSLEWTFKKIKSYPLWDGAGWIDNIELVRLNSQRNEMLPYNNGSNIIINGEKCNQPIVANCSQDSSKDMIDTIIESAKQAENYPSSEKVGSNITILVQNIIYPFDNLNTKKSNITIDQKFPKEKEILSDDVDLEFEYEPSNSSRITNCTLLVDNLEKSSSWNIKNDINKFNLDRNLIEVGGHGWKIKCCECGGLCNFSRDIYFRLAEDSNETHVDPLNPDEAHFTYSNISQAISNTSDFGMIIIEKGTYRESIEINKPLTIIGIDKPLLLPRPGEDDDRIITISSSDIDISGLRLQDADYGIYVAGKEENGGVKNISIRNNEISNCGYDIFAEYCCNSRIIGNLLYYPNKIGICHIGLGLKKCKNIIIESNRFNEAFRVPKKCPMDSCIDMLSYEDKTMAQIKDNTFDYSINGVNIQQEDRQFDLSRIRMLLKKNNNRFNMTDSQIIGAGDAC